MWSVERNLNHTHTAGEHLFPDGQSGTSSALIRAVCGIAFRYESIEKSLFIVATN